MNRSYFSSPIKDFINTDENEILGKLTTSENIFEITPKTTYAWLGEISVIKNVVPIFNHKLHHSFNLE
jgi:hypothetical protein